MGKLLLYEPTYSFVNEKKLEVDGLAVKSWSELCGYLTYAYNSLPNSVTLTSHDQSDDLVLYAENIS